MPEPADQPIFRGVPGNQYGPTLSGGFSPGFLFSCQYLFYKHDPNPLVLTTKVYPDQRVAGLNLHYLTFPYVRQLVQAYCGKGTLSYQAIKGDKFVANAFRTYKRAGLRSVKAIDCQFLVTMLGQLRSFNPTEVEAMRKEVQRQLQERVNPKAGDLARQYGRMIPPAQPAPEPHPSATVPGTAGTIPGQPASIPTGNG